ncbi:MAG TPA: LamG-like jellyroll fold domain-containing protein, partial [Gemmataceae bacterium]|nr:LamG-like jellyroll fold domain-containing protein [Gemmataceae bacterium]
MAIEFVCPTCSHTLRVGDEAGGKVVRCGSCMTTLRVPDTAPVPNAVAPPPPAPPPPPVPEAEEVFDVATETASAGPRKPSLVVKGTIKSRQTPKPAAESHEPATEPREKATRKAAPPRDRETPGRGAGFWILLVILVVGMLAGAIGGGLYYLSAPKWRTHESAQGGFKIDLPAAPRDDLAKAPGVPQGGVPMGVEGTTLRLRSEEYMVMYVDIPAHRRQALSDEALMTDSINGMRTAQPGLVITRNDPTQVSGFSAREIECTSPGNGTALGRVVIAESRGYVILAGGKGSDPNANERFRRFVDSFEVTDPRLHAQAQARKDAGKQAELNRIRAQEDVARRQKEQDDRVAAERKRVEDQLRAAEEQRAAEERARKEEDARIRREAEAFRTAKWTGPEIPDPRTVPGLKLHIPFDGPNSREVTLLPSDTTVPTVENAAKGAGVRGEALYLARETRGFTVLADKLPDAVKRNQSATFAAWVKLRGAAHVTPLLTEMNRGAPFGLKLASDTKQLGVWTASQQQVAPWATTAWTPDEAWHHVAVVRVLSADATGFTYLTYLDGKEVNTSISFGANAVTEVRGLRVAAAGEPDFLHPPGKPIPRRELPIAAIDDLCVFDA